MKERVWDIPFIPKLDVETQKEGLVMLSIYSDLLISAYSAAGDGNAKVLLVSSSEVDPNSNWVLKLFV